MRVIADTSPLIALHRIGHLSLVQRLYRTIWVPPAVRRELVEGSRAVKWPNPLREAPWIRVARRPPHLPTNVLRTHLGAGESEALALALTSRPSLLLVDEVTARLTADALGLRYTGTIGVLLKAKTRGLLPTVRPLLDQLIQQTFHIAAPLYRTALVLAGEEPEETSSA